MMIGTHTTSDMRPALFWDCTPCKIPKQGRSHLHCHKSEIMNIADILPQPLAKYILHKGVYSTALFCATPDKSFTVPLCFHF